ncbi:hypothetical protein ACH5RR_025226 [Cinchona calisaya]|uniref:Tf2-1-like SH3-like domain-containing protein n=1 Tax=Cinchona calisaya TaxID=153742 RepID=A0ABD2Z037_9GENT
MKRHVDQDRRFVVFQVGDKVMVKLLGQRQSRYLRGRDARLLQKYIGPVTILDRIGKIAYKMDTPTWRKVHLVFHVAILKPYHEDREDPGRGQLRKTDLHAKFKGKTL